VPAKGADRLHTLAVLAAVVAAAAILAFLIFGSRVVAQPSPGVVQATEIRIAPEISGRLARLAVTPGRRVQRGDLLFVLSNPELEAALVLAKAELAEAQAARDRVYAGRRKEQVDTLEQSIGIEQADLVYAQQQFARTSKLAADGFASRQDLDKATAAVEKARANLDRAQERYQVARLGPTREQRAVADSKVAAAAAAASVIAARVAKLQVRATEDGVVAIQVAEPGEAIRPGETVMTLRASGHSWASFNLREDRLGGLHIGSRVELLAAGGKAPVDADVTELVPRGDFATWRAARAVGDHDLNTFLVRADPIGPAAGKLPPGLSVWMNAE
jgi:HlyD family secretion protein